MNDDPALAAVSHRLTQARDLLAGERMTIPASEIIATARRRRARRRLIPGMTGVLALAAGGAACAAIGLAVALTLAPGRSARPGPGPRPVQLAAWTVHTNPGGTVTFTLQNTSRPAQLQRALAKAGVPAVVRWGKICLAGGPGQPLISTVGFLRGTSGFTAGVASYFSTMGGAGTHPDLGWSWTVVPSKIPRGGQFVISAIPGPVPAEYIQAVWEFAHTSAPIACARHLQPGQEP